MSIDESLGTFFKPEVRTSGRKLFAQEKVSVASGSETSIQAYVRVAPPAKVRLTAECVGTDSFTADCSCPAAKKGQLCKHVWATILGAQDKYPDFFSGKQTLERASHEASPASHAAPGVAEPAPDSRAARAAASQSAYKEAQKTRAAEYRKAQYEKQKLRAKGYKKGGAAPSKVASKLNSSLPPEAEAALAYFALNGFPMEDGPSESVLSEAKRKLSRVFHPDRGGTHDEITELNRNYELLERLI